MVAGGIISTGRFGWRAMAHHDDVIRGGKMDDVIQGLVILRLLSLKQFTARSPVMSGAAFEFFAFSSSIPSREYTLSVHGRTGARPPGHHCTTRNIRKNYFKFFVQTIPGAVRRPMMRVVSA